MVEADLRICVIAKDINEDKGVKRIQMNILIMVRRENENKIFFLVVVWGFRFLW